MTKTVSANLQAHLDGRVTSMAALLKIDRTDGTSHYFTSHDVDILFSGDLYLSIGGFESSAIESSTGTSVDNLELQTALDASGLTESDIIAGRLDYAAYELFDLNYNEIGDGNIIQRTGKIGPYSHAAPGLNLELSGLMQNLHQRIGRVHQKRCDADLGDTRCGVDLGTGGFTVTGKVTSVSSRQSFDVDTVPAARGGLITWTLGGNNALTMEIRNIISSTLRLALPMPFDISVDDEYSAYRGCDKNPSTCDITFDNIDRFRGFPFMPGNDETFDYPNAK